MKTALGITLRGEQACIKRFIDTDTFDENDDEDLSPIDFIINYAEPIGRETSSKK